MCVSQGDKKYGKKSRHTGKGYSGVKRGICFYASETFDSEKAIRGQKGTVKGAHKRNYSFKSLTCFC